MVPPLTEDWRSIEVHINNFSVPDGQTHYVCQSFAMPIDQVCDVPLCAPFKTS